MSQPQFTVFSVLDEPVRYSFDIYMFNSIVSTSWLSSRGLQTSRSLELIVHCQGERGTAVLSMRFRPSNFTDNDIILGRDFFALYRELYPIYGSIDGVSHESNGDIIPVHHFDTFIPRDVDSVIALSPSTVLSVTGVSTSMSNDMSTGSGRSAASRASIPADTADTADTTADFTAETPEMHAVAPSLLFGDSDSSGVGFSVQQHILTSFFFSHITTGPRASLFVEDCNVLHVIARSHGLTYDDSLDIATIRQSVYNTTFDFRRLLRLS
ncbi:uncharacterized protein EV420DRAFT_255274 [Desarmillaria tabescens]|uniref:Uncharacterized protein n=1 Tax=Armillaria tabescens TaxID=1929756 RepID=A0AA39KHY4_ARMTA|nr:uncharacterized protein EV420DRAFT_255274 [Desarmillaria tabescens]KAK0460194.1 hypothetical protein EV420DRAFT_255274 [Desarmillaria tabescens]